MTPTRPAVLVGTHMVGVGDPVRVRPRAATRARRGVAHVVGVTDTPTGRRAEVRYPDAAAAHYYHPDELVYVRPTSRAAKAAACERDNIRTQTAALTAKRRRT